MCIMGYCYVIEIGRLERVGHPLVACTSWGPDGVLDVNDEFIDRKEAEAYYRELDLRCEFAKEWDASTVKPRNSGFYKTLSRWNYDEEGPAEFIETLVYDQYTADEYLLDYEDAM